MDNNWLNEEQKWNEELQAIMEQLLNPENNLNDEWSEEEALEYVRIFHPEFKPYWEL